LRDLTLPPWPGPATRVMIQVNCLYNVTSPVWALSLVCSAI